MKICYFMKTSKNHDDLPTSSKSAITMKFFLLHENKQKSWNFPNFKKISKTLEISLTSWKRAIFMKICNNYQIVPTMKFSYSMQSCQLHENKQKLSNFADFMTVSKNHEILLTSWTRPIRSTMRPHIWWNGCMMVRFVKCSDWLLLSLIN